MSGSIYKTGSGAILQQMRLDLFSNNLANVNTAGFKADQPVFRLEQTEAASSNAENRPSLSPYMIPMEYLTNFEPGALQKTGGKMDVAIVGGGFFEVQTSEGLRYTRNGQFTINENGMLSTAEGWPVMGQGGEIPIEGDRIEFGEDGRITVDGDVVAVLNVVEFGNPNKLKKAGGTLFVPDNSAGGPVGAENYSISQGVVESSNVNAIRTMTELIETLRAFETYQKVIRAADDATSKTVNEVGRSV